MAEHKHGTMDIRAQEHAFKGFLRLSKFVIVAAIVVLIFLALANA